MLDGWPSVRSEKGRDRLNVWLTSVPTVIMTQDVNGHSKVPRGLDAMASEYRGSLQLLLNGKERVGLSVDKLGDMVRPNRMKGGSASRIRIQLWHCAPRTS